MWRRLIITPADSVKPEFEYAYEYPETRDSKALHLALAEFDPGPEYTVHFHELED